MYLKKESILSGAKSIINSCGYVSNKDKVLIVVDKNTVDVGSFLLKETKKVTKNVSLVQSETVIYHGCEPESYIADFMQTSSIIIGLTKYSMAHTKARFNATNNGARYLSLPDYDFEQLASAALNVDFKAISKISEKIKKFLDIGKTIKIRTEKGTDLNLFVDERLANSCPGFCDKPGMLGSPPDIETNIAPIEDLSAGNLIVDGSIPFKGLGLIEKDLEVKIKNGKLNFIDVSLAQGRSLQAIFDDTNDKKRVLAEFGIGLNPKARLCGKMLEDEGCLGTVHFGFGSNATIGGNNFVNFHIDFVIKKANVFVDDFLLIKEGELLI